MPRRLLPRLRELLGPALVEDPAELAAAGRDWRGRYAGTPLALALPSSTEQVAAVVRLCAAQGVGIVPQGGNTGLVGGATPDASGGQLLLSLKRMQRIRQISPADGVLVAEAGCVLQAVQQAAAEHGLLFPLSLASEGSASIGGVLSSNAGGTAVLRYGNARALCLGLEVVTPQGQVWHGLSSLRKDNTGYDLRDLYIGAEGTLGIITAASLQLFARPAAQRTALLSLPSIAAAVSLLETARGLLGPGLTGFELIGADCLRLVQEQFPALRSPLALAQPWLVLLELSDSESEAHAQHRLEQLLQQVIGAGVVADGVVAHSLAQADAMWSLREHIPLAQARAGLNIKHDIGLPISALAEFVDAVGAELERLLPRCRLIVFGHLGDGNLHFNVQAPAGADPAAFLKAHQCECQRLVHDAVVSRSGSFSAEHGVGQLKTAELRRYKQDVALQLMQRIKAALDPDGIMNPGKVLTVEQHD